MRSEMRVARAFSHPDPPITHAPWKFVYLMVDSTSHQSFVHVSQSKNCAHSFHVCPRLGLFKRARSFHVDVRSSCLDPTRISGVIVIMAESSGSTSRSTSPSPVPLSSVVDVSPTLGRPKRIVVWHYFTYDQDKNQSVCQVQVTRDHGDHGGPLNEACRATYAGKFPTNLKGHLRKDHPAQFQEALQKENEAEQKKKEESAKRRSLGKQLSVVESFKGRSKYDKSSSRYWQITKALAIFIGSTN